MTTVTSRVGLGNLDGPDRDRITLGRPDYADLFRLCTPTASAVPAERWARVMLEEIAGRGGQVIWRFLLGCAWPGENRRTRSRGGASPRAPRT
ncbi:MAG: hypothetical protein WKF47_15375 [Geodermatophilaceae bacterium]